MIYYDKNGECVEFRKNKNLGKKVYLINDQECVKIGIDPKLVSLDTLECIQEMGLEGVYKVRDFLYSQDGVFKAYIMKYYKPEDINFFDMDIDYTIENYLRLKRVVEEFTEKKIFMVDLNPDNVIVNRDGLTIIDTDLYVISKFISSDRIELNNLKALRYIFTQLYIENWEKYYGTDCILKAYDIFELNPDATVKKLQRYNRLVDKMHGYRGL